MRELLLINLEGLRYGIWEDEVLSVEDISSIHHLPMSPAYLAGVSVVRDRTVTLADLSACVGHAPMKKGTTGHVLLLSDSEQFAGFVLGGSIDKASIGPDLVHPVPEYLRTSVIDSCVIIDSTPVPVINISSLYLQMQKLGYEQPTTPILAPDDRQDIAGIEKIKVIELKNELFGVYGGKMEEQTLPLGRVTTLAQSRPFVRGVALQQGRILTIIDLFQRLFMRKADNAHKMLVAEVRNTLFGFLVHEDRGILKKGEFSIRALPLIVQSAMIHDYVMHAEKILPLLDLGQVVSLDQENKYDKPPALRYAPDSRFIDLYRNVDIAVLEFSLLGAFHALPKSEVKDIIPCKPYRTVPNAPDIVIGVTEHRGEVLPVLDLAMVFGRRSLVTPEWRMIHVVNGDFQALVLSEIVFGERRLPRENQRAVPIILPHHVVYGCYPEADTVRLILNVAALAMYFEKSLVQDLLPALSYEMMQARAELVPSLLEESAISSAIASESETPKTQPLAQEPAGGMQSVKAEDDIPVAEQQMVPETVEAEHLSGEAERERQEREDRVRQEAEEQRRREAEERQEAAAAARAAEEERVRREAEETARQEADEIARREAEEQARRDAEAKALREAEEQQKAEIAARLAEEERIHREAEEKARQEKEEAAHKAAEDRKRQEAEEQTRREAEERQRAEAAAVARAAAEERVRREAEEKARQEAEEQARKEAEAKALQEAEERQKAEAARAVEEERIRREAEEKARQEAEEAARKEAEERVRQEAEEQVLKEAEAKALQEAEERQKSEAAMRAAEEEQVRRESEEAREAAEKARKEAAARMLRESEEQARREAEARALIEAEEREKAEAAARLAEEEQTRTEAEAKAREDAAAVVQEAEDIARREKEKETRGATVPSTSFTSEEAEVAHAKTLAKPSVQRKSFVFPVIIGIILAILLYAMIRRPPAEMHEVKAPVESAQKKAKGPLVLTVPNGMSGEAGEYTVKKGDTLWGISKRFTGSPFNYPRVAQDNKIANPDLIYPEQTVIIKKKEQ